jgi:hypothetical protein
MDEHNSRQCFIATQFLCEANIDVLILPAHSSTVLQLLDLTVNGEFKRLLSQNFTSIPGKPADIQRIRLLRIAGMVLHSSLTMLHITRGFARAGIYPFSKDIPLQFSLV